ncbi:hypothetical protein [Stenotrophomonas sp. CFBP 13718]|uniref:hypothetical protein n=1 Tax=Stenotrophomonas sp. CFBP 13718 TaxID=2775304 RepID=UPI001781C78D|nr:hypothetical protein [Stenotrophomonas sp. CFBP 13718]MBD8696563.1 hypothetical protein [Stenotrophomonas sp. CFBP 13718]
MSRHPVGLLTPAFIAAVLFAFCLALALLASPRNADSFVLVGGVGALFFGYRTVAEVHQVWKQFTDQLEARKALRRSIPLTRINIRKDDIR